jgi:hypothetical protein
MFLYTLYEKTYATRKSENLCQAFLLTVNAPAVLLAVQPSGAIALHAFVPLNSPVTVQKGRSHLRCQSFTDVLQQVMFLESTVKKGSGKCVIPFGAGGFDSLSDPQIKARSATMALSERDATKPFFHVVSVVACQNSDAHFPTEGFKSIQTAEILRIWVYIRVVKKGRYFVAFRSQIGPRRNETRSAAGMEKYFHEKRCSLLMVVLW